MAELDLDFINSLSPVHKKKQRKRVKQIEDEEEKMPSKNIDQYIKILDETLKTPSQGWLSQGRKRIGVDNPMRTQVTKPKTAKESSESEATP